MKRISLVMVFFAAACFLCSGTTFAASPILMRMSVATPENHIETKQCIEWGRLIEENSKGEIKVQIYHSAQLFRDNEVLKAVLTGGVEAGIVLTMYIQTQAVPTMKVLQMPFLFNNTEEVMKVMHSDIAEGWKKTAEQKGVKLLGLFTFPTEGEGFVTVKPAKVPADVKGTVLRTIGPEVASMIKKWGAGASFLTGAEVYLALQRGTLQGGIGSIASYVERKWYEVAPYFIALPLASVNGYMVVNKGFFDRLSPANQKAVLDASAAIDKSNYNAVMANLKKDIENAHKNKANLYYPNASELAKWKEGCEQVWAESAGNDKDVIETLAKVRAILKR
jgi:C4-dicarboxylate-binding protein DctP